MKDRVIRAQLVADRRDSIAGVSYGLRRCSQLLVTVMIVKTVWTMVRYGVSPDDEYEADDEENEEQRGGESDI